MDKLDRKCILHIVDGFRMGGAENKLWELIDHLDKSKYEVILANVGTGGPLQPQFERLGIDVLNFPRRFGFDPMPLYRLYKFMRKKRVDIVQTTLFWADVIGTIAARSAGIPTVISWETVSHEGDPYHNNFQRRNGYKLMARFSNLIIAVSHEVRMSLIKRRNIPAGKIQVIHYGVDLARFHPNGKAVKQNLRRSFNVEDSDFLIGIVARLEPWKGHDVFLESFAKLSKKYPNVKVIFVGDGSLRSALEQMVKDKNLTDRVSFLGVRSDIADILNVIDLLVLPSRPGEGLPNVLLEAMACQKPVIATAVGGVPELIKSGKNGYVVQSGNVDELTAALERVISDRAHLKELSENALKTVTDEFSLEKQLTAFERLYDNVKAN